MNPQQFDMKREMFNNQKVIEEATVWVDKLYGDGQRYEYRYRHADREMAVKGAEQAVARIDTMRSPHASHPYPLNGGWAVNVTYYGLD